eukprot:TRINITY_DN5320_c0_g1_i1.p1 TRINITY_DN5320_c0_g1~~TRINITY_DN5320_c0_g1_i1.p1  ORF type:complete len:211 (+),score=48.38 TRINITY_DN5320_c0_g1_i1:236-868(+)
MGSCSGKDKEHPQARPPRPPPAPAASEGRTSPVTITVQLQGLAQTSVPVCTSDTVTHLMELCAVQLGLQERHALALELTLHETLLKPCCTIQAAGLLEASTVVVVLKDELHDALIHGRLAEVEAVCMLSPDRVHSRKYWRTPLHTAAQHGRVTEARLLVQAGAVMESEDNEGRSPADLAELYEDEDMMALFYELEMRQRAGLSLGVSEAT